MRVYLDVELVAYRWRLVGVGVHLIGGDPHRRGRYEIENSLNLDRDRSVLMHHHSIDRSCALSLSLASLPA